MRRSEGGSSPGSGVLGDAHEMRRSYFALLLLLLLVLLRGLFGVEHEHEQE
jgi:hypothetical protein